MPSRRSVIIGLGLGLCLFGVVLAAYLSSYAALVELRRNLVGARVPSWLPAGATAGCDFQVGQCYSIASGLVSVSAFINTTRASFESCRDATGAITYAGNNQPCVTSEGFGSTWPASTNLALQSQGGFNNTAYYTKSNVTITDNDGVAPDGTMTASTIIDDDTNATHHIRGQSNILVLSGATYTCSVFALAGTGKYVQLTFADTDGSFTDAGYINVDLPGGVIVSSGGTLVDSLVEPYAVDTASGNIWYRIQIVATAAASANTDCVIGRIGSATATRNAAYVGRGTTIKIWGHQVEALGTASPYIPTTMTTASRASANNLIVGALQTAIAKSTGSIFLQTTRTRSSNAGTFIDSNGSSLLGITSGNLTDTALTISLSTKNTVSPQLPARSVLAWNATGRTLTANTGETVSDATAVTPSTTQHLGSISGSSEFASGVVQMIAVFPTKLSSSEVAALVGDVYTGYTMSYFDDFNSLDIVGPKTPFGKYFATRPYGFTSGPSVDFRSTTTNSLYFPDPLHTGHLDFGRGVTYGYENVRVASSILTLQSRLATAGENMTFVNPAANMNVSFMLHTAGAAIYYPSYMAAVIVEARIRLKPAAASALAGWNASFWTLSGAPVVFGTNTADEWDFFENFVDKQLQFNHNTWSGGSKVSDTIGNYATGRVWDAQFHTFTAVLVNGGFVKLYVDGVETFSAARQANTAAKPMFILFYAAINQAFNQADWTASGSTSISGNSMDVDWFKIWRKIGNPHFVGRQSISSLSVDYASSGSIVLPEASSLWGTTTIQEYVQCIPLEPNEPGTTLTTSYQQFPSGVSYDSLTRTISVNFTGGTGSAGANHCMVYGYGPGATGEPARFNIYRGPNITTGMLTAIRGSPYSHDFYFECDVGIMTPKEIKVTGLPAGLIFDNVSTVSGIPTSAGSSSLSVSCTNNNGQNKTTTVPMNVSD